MPGDFDEAKHPRDPAGRFGSGGGDAGGGDDLSARAEAHLLDHEEAAADDRAAASLKDPAFAREHGARIQEAADTARSYHQMQNPGQPTPDSVVDSAMHDEAREIHREADADAGAVAAETAGHLKDLPSQVAEYEALDAAYSGTNDDLHRDGQVAIDHLSELHALSDSEIEVGQDHDLEDPDSLASQLDDSTGMETTVSDRTGEAVSFDDFVDEDHAGHPDNEPSRDGFDEGPAGDAEFKAESAQFADDHKEYSEKKQKFDAMVDHRRAAYNAKAVEAQDAFEALHEKQVAAVARIKAIDKARDKAMSVLDDADPDSLVNHAAFAGHAKDEEFDDTFADEAVQADYERAQAASEHRLSQASARLGDSASRDPDSMIEAAKATKDLIKQLAKITGRKPRLPVKPAKPAKPAKKSYRPGTLGAASLSRMAPRYKLKLTKLDFLSLVDTPAQETASIRLIKDAENQVAATMTGRVLKISEGDDPLVYCWAFTCTGEDGKPYHDLQGDAISAEDFAKAAEEYLKAGAPVDEMHDGRATGRLAFAYPMDSDIAKAMFGVTAGTAVKTSGLMAAVRPSKESLAKLRSGEYNGVSIAGLGTRELVKAAPPQRKKKKKKPAPMGGGMAAPYKRIGKAAVLTSEVNGHVHSLDLEDPASCYSDQLMTSYQTAEGADDGHCHPWIYDAVTGAIMIGMDSGHTHTVAVAVSPEVIAAAAMDDDEPECAEPASAAQPGTVVVVAARHSTPSGTAATVASQEQQPMEELNKIRKQLAVALSLTEPQRLHVAKLAGADVEAFLGATAAERDALIKEADAADPEVYKTASGLVIRKSHGPVAEMLAKQADASATQITAQAEQLAIAKAAGEQQALEKRATTEIPFLKGTLTEKAAALRAIDAIPDAAISKAVHEMLRGANAIGKLNGQSIGFGGDGGPRDENPMDKFNAERVEFAKAELKVDAPNEAQIRSVTGRFIKTAKGAELYAELNNRGQA